MNQRAWRVGAWVCAACCVAGAARADFDETYRIGGRSLRLANLVGQVRIAAASGSEFEIEVAVRGKDGTPENIKIETDEGQESTVHVRFPLRDEDTYIYPALGRHSRSTFSFSDEKHHDRGLLSLLLQGFRDHVTVKGSGRGMEAWADVTVRVPEGKSFSCVLGVGEITATSVRGNLELSTQSGDLHATSVIGDLECDSGSGSIEASGVTGNLVLDTGSGSVEASQCSGGDLRIDTGSGSVQMAQIDCGTLYVDTGAGRVEGTEIACSSATIDTGSGSIGMAFSRVGDGDYSFDTGSGSVEINLPENPSARFDAETGAGDIVVDLDDVSGVRKGDGEAQFTVGGGAASFKVDSGSGSIHISR